MKFTETKLKGAYLVELDKFQDERGFFARTYCVEEFQANGLDPNLQQISIAFNSKKNTMRGMHYMKAPNEEAKLIRCSRGSVFDVIIDLRPDSDTFQEWLGIELIADDFKMVYLSKGFAHGYITLEDNTEMIYHMSKIFVAESYAGIRWNDSAFKIEWPQVENLIISKKDKNYSDFS